MQRGPRCLCCVLGSIKPPPTDGQTDRRTAFVLVPAQKCNRRFSKKTNYEKKRTTETIAEKCVSGEKKKKCCFSFCVVVIFQAISKFFENSRSKRVPDPKGESSALTARLLRPRRSKETIRSEDSRRPESSD